MKGSTERTTIGGAIEVRWIELAVVLAVVAFLGLVVYADASTLAGALRTFDWTMLVAVAAVTTVGLGLRFVKWEYYLRHLGIDVPLSTSFLVFLGGLLMVLAPMKGGGVWRGWLLRDVEGVPISRIVPVVVAERATDVLALAGLGLLGLVLYRRTVVVVLVVIGLFVVATLLLQWRGACLAILDRLAAVPVVGRHVGAIETAYEDAYVLFSPRPLAVSLALSLGAWAIEGLCVWLVLAGFGIASPPAVSVFVFSVGSLVGGITMLPGGLATTEASIAGLLLAFGYSRPIAAGTTILVRVGTLWYGVLLGVAGYAGFRLWVAEE